MLINEKNIFLNIKGDDKYKIIKEMILNSTIEESKKEFIYRKVKEREELQATSVGNGIGLAHAKIDDIENIEIMVATIKDGVDYEAYDEEYVKLLFVVIAPKEKNREYLNVLAKISKICRNDCLIDRLIEEDSIKGILDNIREI